MKNISFSSLLRPIKRYHLTIFIVFVVASLGYAVFTFTNLLSQSSTDASYTSPASTNAVVNQATLEKLKALHTSDEPTPPLVTPSGRINPFSE